MILNRNPCWPPLQSDSSPFDKRFGERVCAQQPGDLLVPQHVLPEQASQPLVPGWEHELLTGHEDNPSAVPKLHRRKRPEKIPGLGKKGLFDVPFR
jgi:hypothetical protein